MLAASLVLLSVAAAGQTDERTHLFAQWAAITRPFSGRPAAIGFYSAGCLQGAEVLPLDGVGYAAMRPSRRRFYGHPLLIGYLTTLATRRPGGNGRLLLVGDLGPARGGPTLSGHASHQNGLDVDIWFMTRAADQPPPNGRRWALPALSSTVSG